MKKTVSVLIPCYNEEKSLPLLHAALQGLMKDNASYNWQIIFIDDGSKDDTLVILRDMCNQETHYSYVSLSRNFGKENAMLAGFDRAAGDCMIIMDADLQHPPQLIPEMLACWEEGYQDVYARRKDRNTDSWLRKRMTLRYYKLLQKAANIDILPNVGDFRLLDRICIDALKQLRETERYTKGMYSWIGFRKKELLFEPAERVAGQSSFTYRKLFSLALEGLTSSTIMPLRISSLLGVIVSSLSFVMMLFFFFKAVFYGDSVQGFPTLITVILFLGGLQLLSLGIIGEYVGRVFLETKHRPVYLVKEEKVSCIDE